MAHSLTFHQFLDKLEHENWASNQSVIRDGVLWLNETEGWTLPLFLARSTTIEDLRTHADELPIYAFVLMQAGRASLAVGQGDTILESKQIQKYMTRKSQGRMQLSYLNEKGKSRLGSRIRLRESEEFFVEIDERLTRYKNSYQIEEIFLSITPKLKGFWYQSGSVKAFEKKDPRWTRIPFMVHPPGQEEMYRIVELLGRSHFRTVPDA